MAMLHNKALGSNGLTYFFQDFQKFIRLEVHTLVEESQQSQKVWSGPNGTFITLIHKFGRLEDPNGLCPIDLHNFIYKIISSIIVNCLKPLLNYIISLKKQGLQSVSKSLMVI